MWRGSLLASIWTNGESSVDHDLLLVLVDLKHATISVGGILCLSVQYSVQSSWLIRVIFCLANNDHLGLLSWSFEDIHMKWPCTSDFWLS